MFNPLQCSMEGKPDSNAIREGVGDLGDVGAELVVCLDVFRLSPRYDKQKPIKHTSHQSMVAVTGPQ
jgi:hypothetical protein